VVATTTRRGVFPGSFNPPTTAHLAISEAVVVQHHLDVLVWSVSRVALAKEDVQRPRLVDRIAVLEDMAEKLDWLEISVTEAQLLSEIAAGFDVIVMGADKWLEAGTPISGADMAACAEAQGTPVRAGDIVLIRTGYLDMWWSIEADPTAEQPFAQPGINNDGARWLAERDVVAVGSDNAAIEALCVQPGIGPWSAAIYLMSALKRIDVWAPGDLALRRGIETLFPGEDVSELAQTGDRWQPWRAVAARLVWHHYRCRLTNG